VESYRLEVKRSAAKEIADLPKAECQRVVAKIQLLASNPRPHGCEKLSGAEKYRIRQGDYRILYEINDSTKSVIIVKVGNRKESTAEPCLPNALPFSGGVQAPSGATGSASEGTRLVTRPALSPTPSSIETRSAANPGFANPLRAHW